MEIIEVNAPEYAQIISSPYHVFGLAAFNDFNKNKCSEVHYLLFKEGKYRLGIIGGIKDNSFCSPFSAPYGGLVFISPEVRLRYIESSLELLKKWVTEKKYDSINITLPPTIYEENFITKQSNCLIRKGYKLSKFDMNYSVDLNNFENAYLSRIWYNAQKNLRLAQNSNLNFVNCINNDEKHSAYKIIQENRKAHGFPLRMEWQQVIDTSSIVPADFFLVFNEQKIPVASAIVFLAKNDIRQVVYWGALQNYLDLKPTNFLSYNIFCYYNSQGIKVVDIGPSTENSVPSYGLCDFKESIGCKITAKLTFSLKL